MKTFDVDVQGYRTIEYCEVNGRYTDTRQHHFNTTGSGYMVGQASAGHLGLKEHKIETFH